MPNVHREDCVKNPLSAKDDVGDDGEVVHPHLLVGESIAQEWRVAEERAERDVHVYNPQRAVYSVKESEGYEYSEAAV
jgi:hypothetical protein